MATADTGRFPALAEAAASLSSVLPAQSAPDKPATARPPGNPTTMALAILVALLMGTGGGTVFSSILGPDEATTARLSAAEGKLAAVESRMATIEADQQTSARMLRDQGRTLLWIVSSMQRQSAAIGALADAQGVKVDLTTPPMLPAGVVDTGP